MKVKYLQNEEATKSGKGWFDDGFYYFACIQMCVQMTRDFQFTPHYTRTVWFSSNRLTAAS
jgi:hypothetical protein